MIVAVIGMVFVIHDALPYFRLTEAQLGRYGPHRPWLVVHITAGIIALLSGLSLPRVTTGFQAIHRRS